MLIIKHQNLLSQMAWGPFSLQYPCWNFWSFIFLVSPFLWSCVFGGKLCDTPGVYFALYREIYPNLGCSVKISICLSHLSSFIKLLMNVSPNLKLFDLKNNQIWSLLKLLFLKANANSKVNIVSQLPSRLIYLDSRQLWCYLIYVRIRFLDSRSTSKYLIQIRNLPQNLFVSTSNYFLCNSACYIYVIIHLYLSSVF
jgi:hypothetical protein